MGGCPEGSEGVYGEVPRHPEDLGAPGEACQEGGRRIRRSRGGQADRLIGVPCPEDCGPPPPPPGAGPRGGGPPPPPLPPPCRSSQRSASMAAMHPMPAAVTACR